MWIRLVCQNVLDPRMSQVGVKKQKNSARSSRSIVLYPTLKTLTPPVIATVS